MTATQKKGYVLDGFFADHYDAVECEVGLSPVDHVGGGFSFVSGLGCKFNGVRVSDHAPVQSVFALRNDEMFD